MPDYRIPTQCDFNDVGHKYSSNSCSPEVLTRTFEGLLINAPEKIVMSKDMWLPVACTYAFSQRRDLGIFQDVAEAIEFTIVDQESKIAYAGRMFGIQNPIMNPDAPTEPVKREELPDNYYQGYVNPDLLKITNMPKKAGLYRVYATLKAFRSNDLTVEIIPAN